MTNQFKNPVTDYLVCALWSSTDDDGEPLDDRYGVEDISAESVARAESDFREFTLKAGGLLDGLDLTQVAHDLWLTRNGHGAGFWDGDYSEEVGSKLTDLAHDMGELNAYVGDDSKVYIE